MAHVDIHIRDIRRCYLEKIACKLDGERIAAENWQTIANELSFHDDIETIAVQARLKGASPSLILLDEWKQKEGSKAYILRNILERSRRDDCVAILDEAIADCNVVKLYAAIQEKNEKFSVKEIQTTRDATLHEALANICEPENYEIESPKKQCGWETKAMDFKSQEIRLKRKSLNQLSPEVEMQDNTVSTTTPPFNIGPEMECCGEQYNENKTDAEADDMETDAAYTICNEKADEHNYIFPKMTNEEHVYTVLMRQPCHKSFGQSVSVPYGMPFFRAEDMESMMARPRSSSLQPSSDETSVKTCDSAHAGDEPEATDCSPPCSKINSFPTPVPSTSGPSQRKNEERRSLPQFCHHPSEDRVSSVNICEELLKSLSCVPGWMPDVKDLSTMANILKKVKNADGHYALWLTTNRDTQKAVLSVTHLGEVYNYRIHHSCPNKFHIYREVHVAFSIGELLEYHKAHGLWSNGQTHRNGQTVRHISLKTPVVCDTRL